MAAAASARPAIAAGGGATRVVCQANSLQLAESSITDAEAHGYVLRPSQGRVAVSAAEGSALIDLNRRFFQVCGFDSIQQAVNESHNNDRVVIMPGVYSEPASRAAPTNDPRCQRYLQDSARGAGLSYRYQYYCPNDQSLVNVLGRALGPQSDGLGPGAAPSPPLKDRHGIPNLGRCIRCNLQVEGSGIKPEDVAIDSGDTRAGNRGPSAVGSMKDVAFKVDRADGIVLRNFTVRHSKEHAAYVLETNGYLLDRMKYLYAGEYGHLTFTSDHGLTQNCEAAGNGDAGVYPGGAPDTGAQATSFYGDAPRFNQEIRYCDVRHNGQGNSGTMGNAILLDHNDFYDNVVGINVDSLYPGGHPGYPQDSAEFRDNNVYSNNFDMYASNSDVHPAVYAPIGTGILITGGNDDRVVGNRIWDNWRRGTMLIGVPNQVSELDSGAGPGSTGGVLSTSYDNLYTRNIMGIAPNGKAAPNGVDFWWDERVGNTGNRWCANDGLNGKVTTDPSPIPGCDGPSVGHGNAAKDAELFDCGGPQSTGLPAAGCNWFTPPPKPSSSGSPAPLAGSPWPSLLAGCNGRSPQSGLASLGCPNSQARLFAAGNTARLQTTTCADWHQATPRQRMGMIAGLAGAATRPDPENYGPTLVESTAYAVLQSRCAPSFARGILLYEIYNRAASFQGLGTGP